MKAEREYESEKEFQLELAADMKLLGWTKVITECSIPGTQYAMDIVATGNFFKRDVVIECKKARPDSLSDAIAQVLKYRGIVQQPDKYVWALSWPGSLPTFRDRERLRSHKLLWIDPKEIKREAWHPGEKAEQYLQSLSQEIKSYEKLVSNLRDTHADLSRNLEAHKSSMRMLEALKSISTQQAKPGK